MDWQRQLTRWTDAKLIDGETAERIRAFEREHPSDHASWPVRIALTFGGVAIGAGVLLFVSAHWDALSPAVRFALVLALTAAFHVGSAFVAPRLPALASVGHALGTIALGAGIFLTGQIFNLAEHWPRGVMLWSLGAFAGWALLRDTPQFVLLAVLAPLWLVAEWVAAIDPLRPQPAEALRILAIGLFLLALAYVCSPGGDRRSAASRYRDRLVLNRLGSIVLIPTAFLLGITASETLGGSALTPSIPAAIRITGWLTALLVPAAVAAATRGRSVWMFAIAMAWTLMLFWLRHSGEGAQYAWWGIGSVAFVAWGVREARVERINLGSAIFAATVLAFYFSQVMDKLNRSLSLVVVGLLFLGGGAALERMRRRLVARATAVPQ